MCFRQVAKAAYAPVERDGHQIERAERGQVPFHVGKNDIAQVGREVAVEDFLGFRGAVEDVLNPTVPNFMSASCLPGPENRCKYHCVREGGNAAMYGLTIRS